MQITWLSNYSFIIRCTNLNKPFTILVDPQGDNPLPIADLIIVTQFHPAHCNLGIIRKSINDNTHVLGTEEFCSNFYPSSIFKPGNKRIFDDVEVFAIPAKNIFVDIRNTKPLEQFAFTLHAENKTLFFIGDSDFVPGMEKILPDVFFVPVGGTTTLNAKQAAGVNVHVAPKLAVPCHWGGFVGSRDDAELFCELCNTDCKVVELGGVISV